MPNHCANTLKITANTPEARALLAKIRQQLTQDEKQIFQTIHPCPPELMETPATVTQSEAQAANLKKFGYADWYSFSVNEWGTKWEAYEVDTLADEGDSLTIGFDTAWSPPIGIYESLHAQGFDVEATFIEQGCDFVGFWRNGEDHTEELSTVATKPKGQEDNEDLFIYEYFNIARYFAGHGITHSPAHFGG